MISGLLLTAICRMTSAAVAEEWRPADPAHWIAPGFDFSGWNERVHHIEKSETTTGDATAPHDLVSVDLTRVGATAIEYSSLAVVNTRTGSFVSRGRPAKAVDSRIHAGPHPGCEVLDFVNTNDPALEDFKFHATPIGEFWIEDVRGSHMLRGHRFMMLEHGCLKTATIFWGMNWREHDRDGEIFAETRAISFGLDEDRTPLITEAYAYQQTPCGKTVSMWNHRTRRYRLTASGVTLVDTSTREGYSRLTFPFSDRLVKASIPRVRWEKSWRPGARAGVIAKGAAVTVVGLIVVPETEDQRLYRIYALETGTEGFAWVSDLHKACWNSIPPCDDPMRDCPDE